MKCNETLLPGAGPHQARAGGLPSPRNLDARRHWGHAKDYVEMQCLQQQEPEDYVIATGQQYSVRDYVNAAAAELGILDSALSP